MPWKTVSFAIMLTLIASALSGQQPANAQSPVPPATVPKDILLAGKADFMTYCATCHGRDGVGNGPVAKNLVTAPADLTTLTKNNGGKFPESRVHMVIDGRKEITGHGTREMPIWGNWFKFVARIADPQRVDDETAEIILSLRVQGLIEYLNTIQKK